MHNQTNRNSPDRHQHDDSDALGIGIVPAGGHSKGGVWEQGGIPRFGILYPDTASQSERDALDTARELLNQRGPSAYPDAMRVLGTVGLREFTVLSSREEVYKYVGGYVSIQGQRWY